MKEIRLNNHTIEITHPEKILFPKNKITKQQIIEYYLKVADKILPLLKDRPLTLNIYPQGIDKSGFYQQHSPSNLPDWMKTIELEKKDGEKMHHIICNDVASLIYWVNRDAIVFHRWLSSVKDPYKPNLMIIDIDPPDEKTILTIKAIKIFKEKLEEKGYNPYLITTGAKGFHLIDKPKKGLTFKDTKNFLDELSYDIASKFTEEFTTEIRKEKREGRIYLDTSRNSYGQTAIVPFSIRAIEGAPVAHFVGWKNLDRYLKPLNIDEVS